MSLQQHIGDLIFPWPFGHFEIWTELPSSSLSESSLRGSSHLAQVAFTPIPQL